MTLLFLLGLCLLGVFVVLAYKYLGGRRAAAQSAAIFIAPWLAMCVLNLWLGVTSGANYFLIELIEFLGVFGVPALIALVANRLLRRPASAPRIRIIPDPAREVVRLHER